MHPSQDEKYKYPDNMDEDFASQMNKPHRIIQQGSKSRITQPHKLLNKDVKTLTLDSIE